MDTTWEEVERIAQAAMAGAEIADKYPQPDTIARWMRLFGYSHLEAVQFISDQRGDYARESITDDHWNLIKTEKEAAGFDREAYEHSLQLPDIHKSQSAIIPTTSQNGGFLWLFRLGGLLDTPEKVQKIAGLEEVPKVVTGFSETQLVKFCYVDKEAKKKLEEWLVQHSVLQK